MVPSLDVTSRQVKACWPFFFLVETRHFSATYRINIETKNNSYLSIDNMYVISNTTVTITHHTYQHVIECYLSVFWSRFAGSTTRLNRTYIVNVYIQYNIVVTENCRCVLRSYKSSGTHFNWNPKNRQMPALLSLSYKVDSNASRSRSPGTSQNTIQPST